MTAPQNASQVAAGLADISRQLDAATRDLARLDMEAVAARRDHEVAFAHAFLTSEGAMDVRKQLAIQQTADKKYAAEVADAKVRAQREAIRTLHARIDVGRSLGAAVRAEVGLVGAA